MATAIFQREFNYSSRNQNAGWSVSASPNPQTFPEELVAAAVEAGAAERVKPARKRASSKEADNG